MEETLFSNNVKRPLAARLRPQSLKEVVGQEHIVGDDAPLGRMIKSGKITSFILWGPPGCGKSTFMRRAAAALEERGLEPVYIHCSGDPDSLDGVIFPAIGTAIVDGTAPHVLEPRYALAHERYVDLSQCCDSAAAKEVATGLTALPDAYRASYREAYHDQRALGGVDAACRSMVRAHLDEEKLLRRSAGIAARESLGG